MKRNAVVLGSARSTALVALLTDLDPKVEKYYAMPPDDLAVAVAAFLSASYEAAMSIVVKDPQSRR